MNAKANANQIVGNRLRAWRHRWGISQRDVASALQLDRTAVSEIERGRRRLTFVEFLVLRRKLNVQDADLSSDRYT